MKNILSFIKVYLISIFNWIINLFIGDLSSVSNTIDIFYEIKKKNKNFHFENYKTDNKTYQTWLDKIYNKVKLPDIITSLLLTVFLFIIGYIISYFIDFQKEYSNTYAIYLICLGFFISIQTIRNGSKNIHNCFAELRPCYMISDNEYLYFLDIWFKRLSNNKIILFITLLFTSFLGLLLYYKFFDYEMYKKLNLLSIELESFKINNWYSEPYIKIKFFLFIFIIFIVASILITSLRILFVNFFFLIDTLKLPVIPIPNLIRARLNKLTKLYLFISINWFIGVSLFGVMLFNTLDWLSISVLLIISLIGIITFLTPQIIYSKLVSKSFNLSTNWIFSSFYDKLNIKLVEKRETNIINSYDAIKYYKLDNFTDFFEASKPVNTSVYNYFQILIFLFGQIFSILSPKFIEWFLIIFKNFK